MEITKIPTVKVTSNSVVVYEEWHGGGKGHRDPLYTSQNDLSQDLSPLSQVAENKHSNDLSFKAISRIKKSINTLLWLSSTFSKVSNKVACFASHKVTFVTLTLSSAQIHNDNYIKSKLLNQFFVVIRKKYKKLLYVWRQEFQKNDNIHFHIVFNKFIPWQYLRSVWNKIQLSHGYLKDYIAKHEGLTFADYIKLYPPSPLRPKYKLYKSYIHGVTTKWRDPNSTDIHSLKKVQKVSAYICKYLTKKEDYKGGQSNDISYATDMQIELRLNRLSTCSRSWFASSEISSFKYPTEIIEGKIEREIDKLFKCANIFHSVYEYTVVFSISPERLYNLGFFTLFKIFYSKILNSSFYKPI